MLKLESNIQETMEIFHTVIGKQTGIIGELLRLRVEKQYNYKILHYSSDYATSGCGDLEFLLYF